LQGLRIMDLYAKKGVDPKRIYIKVIPLSPVQARRCRCHVINDKPSVIFLHQALSHKAYKFP